MNPGFESLLRYHFEDRHHVTMGRACYDSRSSGIDKHHEHKKTGVSSHSLLNSSPVDCDGAGTEK